VDLFTRAGRVAEVNACRRHDRHGAQLCDGAARPCLADGIIANASDKNQWVVAMAKSPASDCGAHSGSECDRRHYLSQLCASRHPHRPSLE
jgi:hypothetical protein